MTLRERLENKICPEAITGCWLWTGSISPKGYGQINSGGHRGKPRRTHRAAWELYRGPIPDGLQVLHKCDTPTCVNPDHLFLGTGADNMKDKANKGRGTPPPHYYGHRHHMAVLTAEQEADVQRRLRSGDTIARIVSDLGLRSRAPVVRLKRGLQCER